MKVFAVLALCILAVSAEKKFTTLKDLNAQGVDTRIINGQLASEGQFPWQVAVNFVVGGSGYFCGGALIDPQWVLTAGHCADGASSFTLRLGSTNINGAVSVSTTEAYVHPGYNDYLNNDIALIKLQSPVQLSGNIQTIPLASSGDRLGVGESVRVSGWGKTADSDTSVTSNLRFVDLTTISNLECMLIYGLTVQDNTLCCEGGNPPHSTCNGDSGGPVTQSVGGSRVHVGVVSFVHSAGCESGNPSGYIRTESMLDWIGQYVQ